MGFDRSRLGDAHVGRGDAGGGGGSEGFDRVPQRQGDSAAGSAAARSANGWVLFATGVHPEAQVKACLGAAAAGGGRARHACRRASKESLLARALLRPSWRRVMAPLRAHSCSSWRADSAPLYVPQEDDVLDHFADYGQVTNLHLNQDRRTGEVRGYALVEFAEYADAKDAKDNLDRKALLGQELCVDWAFVKRPERRR